VSPSGASHVDRRIAEAVAAAAGTTVSRLGLRFDRVVIEVLGELRRFAEGATPNGQTVLVTLTAPIRAPSKTTRALEQEIGTVLVARAVDRDRRTRLHGNAVRLRLVEHTVAEDHRLIGFVHNPDVSAAHLLRLAERWLQAGGSLP
jgi:hypothetical protein